MFYMCKGTLAPGLGVLQNAYRQHAIHLKILSENLHKDLGLALKQLITQQDLIIKDKSEFAKRMISDRDKITKTHDKAKLKYSKEFKEGFVTEKSLKLEEKYKKSIEKLNVCNKSYSETMKKLLVTFEEQEEENAKKLKEILTKMIFLEQGYLEAYKTEYQPVPSAIENFNPSADLQKFIMDNLTDSGIQTVKFMPYLPPTPRESLNSVNNKEEMLKAIIQKLWDGEQLSREEGSKFL